jgi:hypothetical protein
MSVLLPRSCTLRFPTMSDAEGYGETFKSEIAEAAGYTGEAAKTFASLLTGETAEELAHSAARILRLGKELNPPIWATDPSQGHGGPPRYTPADAFVQKMEQSGVMERIRQGRRDPWTTAGT